MGLKIAAETVGFILRFEQTSLIKSILSVLDLSARQRENKCIYRTNTILFNKSELFRKYRNINRIELEDGFQKTLIHKKIIDFPKPKSLFVGSYCNLLSRLSTQTPCSLLTTNYLPSSYVIDDILIGILFFKIYTSLESTNWDTFVHVGSSIFH